MKTITFYVVALLCFVATRLNAQETFEQRAATIANNIERIAKEEKDSLKIEVDAVNQQLENNQLTQAQADVQRQQYAEKRAKNIEDRVAAEQQKLAELVQDKVDGKVVSKPSKRIRISIPGGYEEYPATDTVHNKAYDFKRTTSQFLFAIGANRMVNDGEIDTDNFKWNSDFYEWGVTWNTRMLKNSNLLHVRYGLSLQYNNFRPKDDKVFALVNGQTTLMPSGIDLDLSRLRIVNLVVPVHLEFDFGGKKTNGDKTYYPVQDGFRVGIGGYAGFNVKEKQIIKFENEDGNDVKQKTKGGFNANDFVYGVSAYVGIGDVALYAKYDLQTIFSSNDIDQNNVSFGIRFDIN